jgi:hypothetical protein
VRKSEFSQCGLLYEGVLMEHAVSPKASKYLFDIPSSPPITGEIIVLEPSEPLCG